MNLVITDLDEGVPREAEERTGALNPSAMEVPSFEHQILSFRP
jgi:hypothetical protein